MSASYLWFAPFAGLWPSFALDHRLASALAVRGREVTVIHCQGVLDSFCPVMSAQGVTATSGDRIRHGVCRECQFNSHLMERVAPYRSVDLDSWVTAGIGADARRIVDTVSPANWSELVVDDIAVGRYASYLTLLNHKLPDVTSTDEAWADYRADLFNALLVLKAAPALLDDVRPTHVLAHNVLYPTNRMLIEVARARGIQTVPIHAGGFIPARYETAGVYHHISASQTLVDSASVRASLQQPCSVDEIRAVSAHVRELMGGQDPWVYSSAPGRHLPDETRQRLGVRPDVPVVACLISSPDETRASVMVDAEYQRDPSRGVSDVPEFLDAIRESARRLPDIDFVIRLHPRLMPNKRDAVTSPDLLPILERLRDLPVNVVVNGPADGLSLYDVMTVSDAGLNQSSSAGLEFLLMGLPVVQYDPIRQNAYPVEFSLSAERGDPEGLATSIAGALAQGWSLENVRHAYRWYAATLLRVLLHLEPVGGREAAPRGAESVPARPTSPSMRVVRAVTPDSVREAGAKWLDRRARTRTVPIVSPDDAWVDEWIQRVDAAQGTTPVWEPAAIRRGSGNEATETAALVSQVRALLLALNVRVSPGLGALGGALDATREDPR